MAGYRLDTDLVNFPTDAMSWCSWVYPYSVPTGGGAQFIVSKHRFTNGKRGWAFYMQHTVNGIRWGLKKADQATGTTEYEVYLVPANAILASRWYHVGFTIDATGNYRIRVHDVTNSAVDEATGTFTDANGIPATTAPYTLSSFPTDDATPPTFAATYTYLYGRHDETVIFDKAIAAVSIDAIYAGSYGIPTVASEPSPGTGAPNIAANVTLSWTNGTGTNRSVYLEAANPPTVKVVDAQDVSTYDPPVNLNYSTTYYWKVVEHGAAGDTESDVWSFTTMAQPATIPGIWVVR